MKRSRWMTTAVVLLAAALVDLDASMAFSPASDGRSNGATDRRKDARSGSASTTDLGVAVAPMSFTSSPAVTKRETKSLQTRFTTEIISFPSRSRAVSFGKRNLNTRILRQKTFTSTTQMKASRTKLAENNSLLSMDEERKLTHSIRSLRRAVRIRDELVDNEGDYIPTEAEWAETCEISVMGLRRVMYEGQQARTILVSANAGLVTSIAKRHYLSLKHATEAGGGLGTILTLQDMIQEGNLGLMQAAERFEPERKFRFSTYATYWIKQRILRAISDSSRIIRLPAHGKCLFSMS